MSSDAQTVDVRLTLGALLGGCLASVAYVVRTPKYYVLSLTPQALRTGRFPDIPLFPHLPQRRFALSLTFVGFVNPLGLEIVTPSLVLLRMESVQKAPSYSLDRSWSTVRARLTATTILLNSPLRKTVIAAQLLITKTWAESARRYRGVLIASLAISAGTDVLISSARYYHLRALKQGYVGQTELIDSVVVFTINDGLLTSAVAIGSIICYLTIKNTLVWIALYFTLSKLYSNSVLATLNLRNWNRHMNRPMGIPLNVRPPAGGRMRSEFTTGGSVDKEHDSGLSRPADEGAAMEVYVDQQVEYNVHISGPRRIELEMQTQTRNETTDNYNKGGHMPTVL
ncbi:hypothetical protein C8F01DRAFT_1084717 [Mycena amicta]|nr:hypothetical protein C8F01DRAFT_1084717 [Mycena amicta]